MCVVTTLERTWPFYVIFLVLLIKRIVRLLYFHLIRRRRLIVSIGVFSDPRFITWALALPFVAWVDLLYSQIRRTVLINGYTTSPFRPTRGVRQGCPLSPLLYVISIEVLAENLRAHPDIVGLRLPHFPNPLPALSLYTDDTSVIVTSDTSICTVFSTYTTVQ